ncbi:unnamed protein product [Strongylus vulgaris]|uniref:Uncharacterized protein n=1 Tax=Strongylus vulgaris TaxID=40348 RepID=A0A3P7J7C8_STRVU|nr:unnamed protein product [Strongylus vulgaris]
MSASSLVSGSAREDVPMILTGLEIETGAEGQGLVHVIAIDVVVTRVTDIVAMSAIDVIGTETIAIDDTDTE